MGKLLELMTNEAVANAGSVTKSLIVEEVNVLHFQVDHAVAEKYGDWVEKNNYGKKYMGIQRATFVVDRKGKIAHVWPKVKPDGHAQEVVEALKGLG